MNKFNDRPDDRDRAVCLKYSQSVVNNNNIRMVT